VSSEPYIVRKLTAAQLTPLLVFAGWVAILASTGFGGLPHSERGVIR